MTDQYRPASPSLLDLQRWLTRIITDPRGSTAALAEPTKAPGPDLRHLIPNAGGLSREDRLDIYAEGYFHRIRQALAIDFCATAAALGEQAFGRIVARYLMHFPSRWHNIEDVGYQLPEFLGEQSECAGRPWVPDLATLEWATLESFSADDAPLLDLTGLAALPDEAWGSLRFRLPPAVRLLATSWDVWPAWQARWEGAGFVVPEAASCHFVVYRKAGAVEVERMGAAEWALLAALGNGKSLLELATMAQDLGREPQEVATCFAGWVARDLVAAGPSANRAG